LRRAFAVADVDGDGRLDVIVSHPAADTLGVLLNQCQ
jgi:hypothetical protein